MSGNSQKVENVLNLALDATEEEKTQSMNLDIGYDDKAQEWEIIVKYSGVELPLIEVPYSVVYLRNQYAIVRIPKGGIMELAALPNVEYIEKPKRLYFQREIGKLVSCIGRVQERPRELSGRGVIVGILDSGIDVKNSEFQKPDGSTRILNIWDQTIVGKAPVGYLRGTEYTSEDIDRLVTATKDVSGHGTEVASVAVGRNGVAYEADIIVVKMGNSQVGGFPKTTELMEGLDYLIRKAEEYDQPLVVNISFGNTYGSHDGSSLLERFIDAISDSGKTCICVGMGNEGNASGHVQGIVIEGMQNVVELVVERRQLSFDLQLWKEYVDLIGMELISPMGERINLLGNGVGVSRYRVGGTEILLYYGEPSPHSVLQELYLEFIALEDYVEPGIWRLELTGQQIVIGSYNMWLPSSVALNEGTQFNDATPESTVTIPSTASKVISVGAYDARRFSYADFSGRGTSDNLRLVKPDIVAPGVDVQVRTNGGANRSVSGTSYATPFVSGGAALLMEWGIVQGNDSYLYGEKIKSYLRKGARELPGYSVYPNKLVGYGRECIVDSIPD